VTILKACLVAMLFFIVAMMFPIVAWGQLTFLPADPPRRLDAVVAGQLKVRVSYGLPLALHADVLREHGLKVVRALLPYQQSLTYSASMNVVKPQKRTTAVSEDAYVLEEPLLRTYVVSYDDLTMEPERKGRKLLNSCALIEVVEPVYVNQLCAIPNDSLIKEQRMLATISVFEAWDIEPGSDSVLIGISDSGILQSHEDLADALYVNVGEIPDNGIDDDGNGYVDDYRGYNFCTPDDMTPRGNTFNKREGHGTAVAGICGAVTNNTLGIAGVAGRCKLVPMKTMPDNSGGIVYGYESIVYCALNGIKIVNCSWGGMSKSCIDESVIRYAIARDVAIVAASGNHGTSSPFYPCAYRGVLGVGVSDASDYVIGMSGIGPTVDIMAPGEGTKATSNDGTYGGFCCTSGAAPIAAGVLGLVRSKYPALTAIEACALVRETSKPNPWKLIPLNKDSLLLPMGRLDALRAVTMPPDSMPSIEFDTLIVATKNGQSRWTVGDTVAIELHYTSVLAPFTISEIRNFKLTSAATIGVKIISPQVINVTNSIAHNQQFVLGGISAVITAATDTSTFIVADLIGTTKSGAGFVRRLQIPVTPSAAFTNLSNDVAALSVGDRGRIGNTDLDRGQGVGFNYRSWCGQLYEGGLMVGSRNRVVDAVRGVRKNNDHFLPKKRFVAPSPLTSIVTDADAPDSMKLGIEITQSVYLAEKDSGVFVCDISIKNISDSVISDVAAAYFFDWDLGAQPASNFTLLDSVGMHGAVQFARTTNPNEPVVLCAVSSVYSDSRPIAVGVDNTLTYNGFPAKLKYDFLMSGTSSQESATKDIAVITGMRFTSGIWPGYTKTYRQVIVIDTALDRAKAMLKKYAQPTHEASALQIGPVAPTPSVNVVFIPVKGALHTTSVLRVHDVNGREIITQPVLDVESEYQVVDLDISHLATGTYNVTVDTGSQILRTPLIVIK